MLKIRPEHLSALAVQQASGFVERMRLHLREIFPIEVAGFDDLKLNALIEKICAQGEKWGITNEALVERLIELFVSFDQLRRNPLPDWISGIVRYPGPDGVRLLLKLEKTLQFGDCRTLSTESGQKAAAATFYHRIDQAFYDEIKREKGASLPTELMDANGEARPLTMSPPDRPYRKTGKQ